MAHLVADITHTLWVEGHPGRGHRHGKRAWSDQDHVKWKEGEKKAVIMEDKKEGAANVQQRAAMVVNAI